MESISQCPYSAGVPAASNMPRSYQFGIDMLMTGSEETEPTDDSRDCWVKADHQVVHSKISGLAALMCKLLRLMPCPHGRQL